MFTIAIILAVLVAITAPPPSLAAQSATGQVTWYEPGLGACGETNTKQDQVVAVSSAHFDGLKPCNRKIRVSHKGHALDVRVVDRCPGCGDDDLDLSPSAFEQVIGQLNVGRATASWEWI
ncbi:hypothetical protein CP532_6610 [Ophiocordyceps camponoti-leonardi (nom. inval.)]|nr:hypothetical protein CP532_6610 [Ophiocordyceps camponoti-leonardi (nom. inval.)]